MLFSYAQIQSLNDLEFGVYNQVLKLERQVLSMKIRELAESAHVSTTVVLNFCKKMDCHSWSAFKHTYRAFLETEPTDPAYQPILESLQSTFYPKAMQQNIEQVVKAIADCHKMIFIGVGPSGIMARYGALYFTNMGKPVQFIDLPYYPIAEEDHAQTVVMALSVSGETLSVIKRLARFVELGATLISITNTANNTIARMSDINLSYTVPSEEFYVCEKNDTFHVNVTTQLPVMAYIELISKKYHVLFFGR